VSEWRLILGRMAPKFGTKVVTVDSAYSTLTSYKTGARLAENTGALMLTYPDGETIDQDENAAHILLQRYQAASGVVLAKPGGALDARPV
jgi:hypothetical protein